MLYTSSVLPTFLYTLPSHFSHNMTHIHHSPTQLLSNTTLLPHMATEFLQIPNANLIQLLYVHMSSVFYSILGCYAINVHSSTPTYLCPTLPKNIFTRPLNILPPFLQTYGLLFFFHYFSSSTIADKCQAPETSRNFLYLLIGRPI